MRSKLATSTSVLTLLNLCLIVLTALTWRLGQGAVLAPQKLSVRRLELPDLSVLDSAPKPTTDTAAIRDNAVFHNRRSFYEAPAPSQATPVPDYDFAGTMGMPQGKRVAFVKRKSDHTNRTLHVGDDLDGWRVESIDIARVVVAHDGQRYELNSAVANQGIGLVRGGMAAPRVAQSNLHILGAQGTATVRQPHGIAGSVRTYRPPPH
jgi:hypothetical protein